MPTDQYHEPPDELSAEVRTFARIIASFQEEAEAIGWYEQRISVETDDEARKIMEHAQQEEFIHFAMGLEFLARNNEKWRVALKNVLFKKGDIVELGEAAEEKVDEVWKRTSGRRSARPSDPGRRHGRRVVPPEQAPVESGSRGAWRRDQLEPRAGHRFVEAIGTPARAAISRIPVATARSRPAPARAAM